MASNDGNPFRCFHCNKRYSSMESLFRHMDQKAECWNAFQGTRICASSTPASRTTTDEVASQQQHESFCLDDGDQAWVDDVDVSGGSCFIHQPPTKEVAEEKFPQQALEVSEEEIFDLKFSIDLPPDVEFRYSLYALLNHPSIPLYVFPAVMRLLNSAMASKHRDLIFSRQFSVCRTTTKDEIKNLFPVPEARSVPYKMKTKDDGLKETSLVVFNIKDTVLQEVQNPLLWQVENLALKGDRWYQHKPEVDVHGMINVSDAISGAAYARAYKKYITDPETQLLVPFVCWIDESGVTGNLRHPVQPLLMKCLLLKRKLQRNCLLSYIPCATKSAAENKQDSSSELSRGINIQNFHTALSKVFQEWDEAADWFAENPSQVTLGGSTAQMTIVPVILCFLGDHKSQLMLSCSFSNRACSECKEANTWLADDPDEFLSEKVDAKAIRECNSLVWNSEHQRSIVEKSLKEDSGRSNTLKKRLRDLKEQAASNRKKLKSCHVIPCINAFSSFRHIARPINHCSPADHLHVFLLGIMKTSAICTIGWFTDKQKKVLDELARVLFQRNSSSARKFFPRFYIEKGMTNTGNLTGTEWVGFYFALLVVGRTDQGRNLLEKKALPYHYGKVKEEAKERIIEIEKAIANCREESKEGHNNMMNISKVEYLRNLVDKKDHPSYGQFMECIEQMLLLHAFATQKQLWWNKNVSAQVDKSLRNLIKQVVFCFPRVEGDCHKYPKMHLLKHLTHSIDEYGAPINFDCMDGEKALQEFAKHLARTVRSVSNLTYFNQLLAKRLEDHLSIKKMVNMLSNEHTPFLEILNKTMKQRQNSSFEGYENEIELMEEEEEEDEEHLQNQVSGLPSKPHWWMSYKVKHVKDHSTGLTLEDRGSAVCRLVQTDLRVFSTKTFEGRRNSLIQKTIPDMCIRALEEDLVRWVRDAAGTAPKLWKDFLPKQENQKVLVVQGYFSCMITRGKEMHYIRCDPSFLNRSQRYDFVAEEHVKEAIPLVNRQGILEDTATPSKVLMLYANPLDGELRAVTHPCRYNVDRTGQKKTEFCKTSEIYHLDMKNKPFLENLLFTEDGSEVSLRDFPKECFHSSALEQTCLAKTNGTQVTRLGAPMFCVQQHPGLLEDVDHLLSQEKTTQGKKMKTAQLSKVMCMRDFRKHWPNWFCKSINWNVKT